MKVNSINSSYVNKSQPSFGIKGFEFTNFESQVKFVRYFIEPDAANVQSKNLPNMKKILKLFLDSIKEIKPTIGGDIKPQIGIKTSRVYNPKTNTSVKGASHIDIKMPFERPKCSFVLDENNVDKNKEFLYRALNILTKKIDIDRATGVLMKEVN